MGTMTRGGTAAAGGHGTLVGTAIRLLARTMGMPPMTTLEGREVVYRGGYDLLPDFLDWERRNLPVAVSVPFPDVRDARRWLETGTAGLWGCTMPDSGLDCAWSVPPGPQTVRLADADDARALLGRFPSTARLPGAHAREGRCAVGVGR